MKRLFGLALLAVVIALAIRRFVGEPIIIMSASMEPTLCVGEHYWLDKLTCRLRGPRRGEIISFRPPVVFKNQEVLKRVIGCPGDQIELRAKQVWLNSVPLREPYAVHRRPMEKLLGDTMGPLEVPKDRLFVLGDNRDESNDSSVWTDAESGEARPFLPIHQVDGLISFKIGF